MPEVHVELEEHPRSDDSRVVGEGLRDFNRAVIGDPNEVELGVFARDPAGRVVGGLLGHMKWRWVYVAKLWLPDELRGRGIGSRLVRAVEDYAGRKGCLGIYLDTFEYQALPFYEKLGYEQFGVLEGYPPGYRQFHLRKRLFTDSGNAPSPEAPNAGATEGRTAESSE